MQLLVFTLLCQRANIKQKNTYFKCKFLVGEALVTFSLENVITNPSLTLISKTHFTYFYMRILFLYHIFINYYKWTKKKKNTISMHQNDDLRDNYRHKILNFVPEIFLESLLCGICKRILSKWLFVFQTNRMQKHITGLQWMSKDIFLSISMM